MGHRNDRANPQRPRRHWERVAWALSLGVAITTASASEQREPSRCAHTSARVVVAFVVDPDGITHDVQVVSSDNHDFDARTIDAAEKWHFKGTGKEQRGVRPISWCIEQ